MMQWSKERQIRNQRGRPVARGADHPAITPIPSSVGSGEQPEAGVVDQLPSVEELANRLPPEVRTVLDELFRANGREVRRLGPRICRAEDFRGLWRYRRRMAKTKSAASRQPVEKDDGGKPAP